MNEQSETNEQSELRDKDALHAKAIEEAAEEESPPAPVGHVTVLGQVVHRQQHRDAEPFETRWAMPLRSEEQAYPRVLTIDEKWVPLDKGWVSKCSLLCIANLEGTRLQKIPTPEEVEDILGRVVEVFVSDGKPRDMHSPRMHAQLEVPPCIGGTGQDARFKPAGLDRVWLRCRRGKARIKVFVVPE